MEDESRRDFKRTGLILVIMASLAVFVTQGLKLASNGSGDEITGAVVAGASIGATSFILPVVSLLVFIGAIYALSRLNQ